MIFNWEQYSTDKCHGHGYNIAYDKHLDAIREKVTSFIEIGSRIGSAQLWLDYFPSAKIYCVDLCPFDINNSRFNMVNLNQGDTNQLSNIFNDPDGYDIIIDDGPHTSPEQLLCFDFFKDKFNKFYIVEDLHATNAKEGEPLVGNVLLNQKDSEITFQDLWVDIENKKTKDYKYFKGSKYISENLQIHKERGTQIRWPNIHTKPSEIFFIEKYEK